MFKNIDIFDVRATQVTVAFMVIASIERFFHIPHGIWFITTSSMVYSALHPGLVFKSVFLRLIGVLLGVAAILPIWAVIHINFRFAIIILFFTMWALVFFIALPFNRYMMTIVMFSDLIFEWTNPSNFFLQYYVIDRSVCIILIFAVCLVLEYLFFGSENMTQLYYQHLCQKIRKDLLKFYHHADTKQLQRANIFKHTSRLVEQLKQLETLINDYTFEHGHAKAFTIKAEKVSSVLVQEFRKIVCFFYVKNKGGDPTRLNALRSDIEASLNQPLDDLLQKRAT